MTKTMKRTILAVITLILAITLQAQKPVNSHNFVTKMFPENGATNVNIDTHLILTMAEDATIRQQGFVSVYDKKTGKLVDRLDMSIPAGPTQRQPKNPAARYTPVPYIYKSQNITNRNTKAGTPSGVNTWDTGSYQLDII